MIRQAAKDRKKQLKILWGVSLFLGIGWFFWARPASLTLVYGSFLLWAVSAGPVWGGRAPFLAVGFFVGLAGWQHGMSHDTSDWPSPGLVLWTLLVFFSSLASFLAVQLHEVLLRQRTWEQGIARRARLATVGGMAVGMCHELRNHTAVVTGYLDQMKDDSNLTDKQSRRVERSLIAMDRILGIVDQIKHLTHDTTHEPQQPIALAAMLQDALDCLARSLEYRGVEVEVKLDPQPALILGQPVLVQTLLIQLLLQSLEHFKAEEKRTETLKPIHIVMSVASGLATLHYNDHRSRPRLLSEADQLMLQQLMEPIGGTMEQEAAPDHTWALRLQFKTVLSAASPDHDARAAS